MIITYFRSSSFNNWDICQFSYFLGYVLGLPQPSGKSAIKGTVVHKVLECLANVKKMDDKNGGDFIDDSVGPVPVSVLSSLESIHLLADRVFDHYTDESRTEHEFAAADRRDCHRWVDKVLGSPFDPRCRKILAAEPHFDIEIDKPWATYKFGDLQGKLHIKGTIDLVTQVDDETIEIIDWKTGKDKCWATGAQKDYSKLSVDPQLRLYHYACRQLYPQFKNVILTINYIAYSGPTTVYFGPSDIVATEEMLRERFEEIKVCVRPSLRHGGRDWWCSRLCAFGKDLHPDGNCETICEYLHKMMLKRGLDYVVEHETATGHRIDKYQNPGE
jgi:ATP-dependent helicase/DNAse subunit B